MGPLTIILQATDLLPASELDAVQKVLMKLFSRLLIDLLTIFVLIRLIYFPQYKKRQLNFTFLVFNLVILLISFLLNKVELSMGAAFGLFAVFSMLRYRTEEISIKDMTYLFLVIAIGLISAVVKIKDAGDVYEYVLLACINGFILILAFVLESSLFFRKEGSRIIVYDNVQLLHESVRERLIEDLKTKTGLDIFNLTVNKIDLVNDTAQIKIYYYEH